MSLVTCPTDCTTIPCVEFNVCAPEYHSGEISKIYFTSAEGADFVDWTDIAEWTPRLLDCGGDEDSIRTLIGIPTSGDRVARLWKKFNVAFDVDETNDVNYDMLKYLNCNLKFKFWYETSDGLLHGGNGGILATFDGNNVIPKTREELSKFIMSITWRAKQIPERCDSPLF
jgi:hypothetical protein